MARRAVCFDRKAFAAEIRKVRGEMNLRDFAMRTRTAIGILSRIERAEGMPSADVFLRVCLAANLDPLRFARRWWA